MSLFSIYFLLYAVPLFSITTQALGAAKKTKCLNPPRTARRVELYIKECQEEVRTKLVSEAFQIMKHEMNKEHSSNEYHDGDEQDAVQYVDHSMTAQHGESTQHVAQDYQTQEKNTYFDYSTVEDSPTRRVARLLHRIRRVGDLSNGIYHPTLVPFEDKRIAGCLLHCVYARNNAIDKLGWPTLDGLVEFYSEGVNEHGFFMATLRSVNLCLRAVTQKYHVNRRKQPEKGESCDLAFDVFDCISDQITGYCMDHYKH